MLNIYISKALINPISTAESKISPTPYRDAIIEITDIPITGQIHFENDTLNIQVFGRDEAKTNTHLYGQGQFKIGSELDIENENGGVAIACLVEKFACCYLAEHNMLEDCCQMDEDAEGVLFEIKGDEICARIVSGKERPDMDCVTLMGEIQKARPYMDEILEWNMREMMPFEERLQKAEAGDKSMMMSVAGAYLEGDPVEQDAEKAFYWFHKLAELDESDAQFNVGLFYGKGFGTERDFSKAAYWMQRAAENGDETAPKLIKKYQLAAECTEKARAGDAQAQADLAGMIMEMCHALKEAGVEKDYADVLVLAQKSAAQGNGKGLWTLALAYEHGRGVDVDLNKAVELYRKGAELGDAACQHSLGCYYLRGDFLEKDEEQGFEWCMKSAQQGYALALRAIGSCYQFGNGVADDMHEAVKWYEKALEANYDPELAQKVQVFKMLEANGGF